jgi:hypothetical protein
VKRYQPVIATYGPLTQAEMQENERGQYYLRADVDELRELLSDIWSAIEPDSIQNEFRERVEKALGNQPGAGQS